METYLEVHKTLCRLHGKASEYACPCGKPALDWAYQFTGEELRDSKGRHPHSADPDDYAPMCRACHRRFDYENDHKEDLSYSEFLEEAGRRVGTARSEKMRADPEFFEGVKETSRRAIAVRAQCNECEMVSSRGSLGYHQKRSGHTGRTILEEEDDESEDARRDSHRDRRQLRGTERTGQRGWHRCTDP